MLYLKGNNMPAPLVCYIRGLLQGFTCTSTSLSRQFGWSHDQLTRGLRKRFWWCQFWRWLINTLFGPLTNGWLIIDDTVIAKPYGKLFAQASYVFSSIMGKSVLGYDVVLLCWSNGTITLPLAWRWYRPGGKSRIDLALELLSLAQKTWKLQPPMILFDAWSMADRLIDWLTLNQWHFVCRCKRNRILNACPVWQDLPQSGNVTLGWITGKTRVKVIKDDERFLATNELTLNLMEICEWDARRWPIEDVFRFLKSKLHLEECQSRSLRAQQTHWGTTLTAYVILIHQRTTKHPTKTLYQLHEAWMMKTNLSRSAYRYYYQVLRAA